MANSLGKGKNDMTTLRLTVLALAISLFASSNSTFADTFNGYQLSGNDDPAFKSFDVTITNFMRKHKIPGAAVSVAKDGRLAYARGYGLANQETGEQVKPTSLFRIASISKTITSAAILKLVQSGKLSLDTAAFSLIDLKPMPGWPVDKRLKDITVRQLLQHTGGWDKKVSGYDPMFHSNSICYSLGTPPPADQRAIIRFMRGRPLDFTPGSRYAYSNFGYCVLGKIIEKLSGQSYESYVQDNVLKPLGIADMRLGKTLLQDAAANEVHYYQPGRKAGVSVFPNVRTLTPAPYGAWCLESMDANGGWLASAIDIARFASSLDFPQGHPILTHSSMQEIAARPAAPVATENGRPSDHYYGLGWDVRPISHTKYTFWHIGSLDGTLAIVVRRWDGICWVVLFNQGSSNPEMPDMEIDSALHGAANSVERWPSHDLFTKQ